MYAGARTSKAQAIFLQPLVLLWGLSVRALDRTYFGLLGAQSPKNSRVGSPCLGAHSEVLARVTNQPCVDPPTGTQVIMGLAADGDKASLDAGSRGSNTRTCTYIYI